MTTQLKTTLLLIILLIPCSGFAFNTTLSINQNIYSNERVEDTETIMLQVKHKSIFLFSSYETPHLRLMGQGVTDYKMLGVGIGYEMIKESPFSLQISAGYYFVNTDVTYTNSMPGRFNEGIHRYLNYLFADPEIRYWDYYDLEAHPGIGFSLTLKWQKEIENFLTEFLFGYRYLRIPIRILAWDDGHKFDASYGWWQSTEMEDLSCAYIGVNFGYRF